MSNTCLFSMKALGSKEAVEELAETLAHNYARISHFEAEPAEPSGAKDIYTLKGEGACSRSLHDAMLDSSHFGASLESESERLHMAIEAYSAESSIGFQEHVLLVDGAVVADERANDFVELWLDDYGSNLDALNKDQGTAFTEKDIDEYGTVSKGGFGKQYGDFRLLDSMAREYEGLRDMDALRKGEVEIAPQPDGSVGFFFADTSVTADVDLRGESYTLNGVRGDQVAHGEWSDLLPSEQRLYGMEIAKHIPVDKVKEALAQTHHQSLDDLAKEAKERAVEKNAARTAQPSEHKPPANER